MKAIVLRQYEPPETIQFEEVARPEPGEREVLVKVQATTVNDLDWCISMTMVSHTWVEGLFLNALLTGDSRSYDSALRVSLNLAREMLNDFDFDNCRDSGWHLIHLSGAYRATGRRVFLNAARIIVDRVLERQRDSGGWDRLMVPGHCHCDPQRHTNFLMTT